MLKKYQFVLTRRDLGNILCPQIDKKITNASKQIRGIIFQKLLLPQKRGNHMSKVKNPEVVNDMDSLLQKIHRDEEQHQP